jgi:hypothetical protein
MSMSGQHATKEIDRPETTRPVRQVHRVTESIPGLYGTAWSADTASARIIELEAIASSTAVSSFTVSYMYFAGHGVAGHSEPITEYDPVFVARVKAADAAPPAAKFNNIVDMLDWLDRD